MAFHLEFQVILQVNGSRSFPTEKWPHGIYIDWLYFPDYLPTNCGVCEPGGYPTDAFLLWKSLGISLGITSDFTSEWITIFCNRKMITRYFYQPIMLARQPTSELWCVRALCITYGLISALQITWNFTWNSKWIYKWRNNAFLEQEKWSHGISID